MHVRAKIKAMGSLLVFSAFAVLFGAACASAQKSVTTPVVSAPMVLSVDSASNPDVLWIVRQVDVPHEDSGTKTLFGLFACYRSANPEPPKCFLAGTSWKPEDLQWPGAYIMTENGVLKRQ